MVSNDDSEATRVAASKLQAAFPKGFGIWAFQCAIVRVHPMTFGTLGTIWPRNHPRNGTSAQNSNSFTHRSYTIPSNQALTSFIFAPSRDMRSLRGASLDTFRCFPFRNSENHFLAHFPLQTSIFPKIYFYRVSPTALGHLSTSTSIFVIIIRP